jgi:hypothetical protein
MRNLHLSIERLVKFIVDDFPAPLEPWEDQHFVECDVCRHAVIEAASQELARQRTARGCHVSLTALWDYTRGRFELSQPMMQHLTECAECAGILSACRSLDHAQLPSGFSNTP